MSQYWNAHLWQNVLSISPTTRATLSSRVCLLARPREQLVSGLSTKIVRSSAM